MNIKTKMFHVWSHGLVAATLLRWLSRAGIKIVPYYLLEESNDLLSEASVNPLLDEPYETIILDRSNAEFLKGFKYLPEVEKEFLRLWDAGCSCVCLRSEGTVLGYGWFDLTRCNYKYLSFELKSNEAYSFNFYTAKHMRGRNIAPFLRNFLVAHVLSLGRNKRYTIAEKFNTTALKFKEKRAAKLLHSYTYLNLFNMVSKNVKIK